MNPRQPDPQSGALTKLSYDHQPADKVVFLKRRVKVGLCRSGTGSATAGDRLGGVRSSSGAAMSERERAPMESDASEQPVLAAPEDGRSEHSDNVVVRRH